MDGFRHLSAQQPAFCAVFGNPEPCFTAFMVPWTKVKGKGNVDFHTRPHGWKRTWD